MDKRGELLGDVGIHLIMRGPRRRCGVDVKARPLAEIPPLFGVCDPVTARARIWGEYGEAEGARHALKARFGGDVLPGACQPGEKGDDRERGGCRLREIEREGHRHAARLGVVLQDELTPAKACPFGDGLHKRDPSGF